MMSISSPYKSCSAMPASRRRRRMTGVASAPRRRPWARCYAVPTVKSLIIGTICTAHVSATTHHHALQNPSAGRHLGWPLGCGQSTCHTVTCLLYLYLPQYSARPSSAVHLAYTCLHSGHSRSPHRIPRAPGSPGLLRSTGGGSGG